MSRASQLSRDGVLDRQRELAIRGREVEHRGERLAEVGLGHLHPDGVDVGAHQILVAQVDARRGDGTGDHLARLAEEVLVVRAAPRAVGEDQRRLAAAAGPAAALGVVGRRRRHVAQVDDVELGDVDAELHGRRAEEQRQVAGAEAVLALLAVLGRDLGGVLARLEHALQIDEAPVALDEVAVDLGRDLAGVQQARPVQWANLAVRRQPAQGIGIDLVAGIVAAANLLDDAVALQREKQKADGLIDFGAAEVAALAARRAPASASGSGRSRRRTRRRSPCDPAAAWGGDRRPRTCTSSRASSRYQTVSSSRRGLVCSTRSSCFCGSRTSTLTASDRRRTSSRVRSSSSRNSGGQERSGAGVSMNCFGVAIRADGEAGVPELRLAQQAVVAAAARRSRRQAGRSLRGSAR